MTDRESLVAALEDYINKLVKKAVADEREACAKICDENSNESKKNFKRAKSQENKLIFASGDFVASSIASKIRARSET